MGAAPTLSTTARHNLVECKCATYERIGSDRIEPSVVMLSYTISGKMLHCFGASKDDVVCLMLSHACFTITITITSCYYYYYYYYYDYDYYYDYYI